MKPGFSWASWLSCLSTSHDFVIPAKAGIQAAYLSSGDNQGPLDSRFRRNDEGKVVPRMRAQAKTKLGHPG
jgi:hypothetical protein